MKILPATNYCRYFPPFSMGHLWPDFFFQGMNIKMYHYQFLFPLLLTFDAGWKSLRSKSPSKLFKCEFRPLAPIVYWTHICNNDIDRNSDSSDMWSNYCVLTCWCFWCPPPSSPYQTTLVYLLDDSPLSDLLYQNGNMPCTTRKWINQNTLIIKHFYMKS